MSLRTDRVIRCDAPGCGVTVVADPRDMPPRTWWYSARGGTFRGTHACPAHAKEATTAEKALHKWECARVKATNDWCKKNPHPKVPEWLEDIVP